MDAADRARSNSSARCSWARAAARSSSVGNSGGTILFTVYERVRARSDETPWDDDRKLRGMKMRLLEQAAGKLAGQVVSKVRHLAETRA